MLYEQLFLPPTCTDEELKQHYKALAKAVHPDKNINNIELANQAFRGIEYAFKILSNPITREIYDFAGEEGLQIYENFKQQFEDINKDDPEIKQKARQRFKIVRIIHENNRALELIDKQKVKMELNMVYYFMLNAGQWLRPIPYARIHALSYFASVKYNKYCAVNLEVDGHSTSNLPVINHMLTSAVMINGYRFDIVLINELTNPMNFSLEVSKWNYENM